MLRFKGYFLQSRPPTHLYKLLLFCRMFRVQFPDKTKKKKVLCLFLRAPLSLVKTMSSYLSVRTTHGGIIRVSHDLIIFSYDV